METRYVVINENGDASWDAASNCSESFTKFRGKDGAEARAKELAGAAPGQVIGIYELTAEVVIPLAPVQSSRKHPTEHYK